MNQRAAKHHSSDKSTTHLVTEFCRFRFRVVSLCAVCLPASTLGLWTFWSGAVLETASKGMMLIVCECNIGGA
jgi:hypothetical protein